MGCKREMPPGFAEDARNGMLVVELAEKYHASGGVVKRWMHDIGVTRHAGGHNKRAVAQYDADTGELIATYPSMIAAGMEMYGDCYNSACAISRCCRGVYKTACGYAWRYWEGVADG